MTNREKFNKAKEVTRKKWEDLRAKLDETKRSVQNRVDRFQYSSVEARTCGFCQQYSCNPYGYYAPNCPAGSSDDPKTRCGKLIKRCQNVKTIKEAKEVCSMVFKMLDNIRINDGGRRK
jgi:hypothetical protein